MRCPKHLVWVALTLGWAVGNAADPNGTIDQASLDRAIAAARKRTEEVMANPALAQPKPKQGTQSQRFDVPAAPNMGADPLSIAQKYRNSELARVSANTPRDLMVFVSLSMPPETLKRLARQSAKAGAVMVLRGLKGGLKDHGLTRTMAAIKPFADEGASIQIDPTAFSRFNVQTVPTFVLATEQPGCMPDQCQIDSAAVAGDVSLDYALEHLAKRRDAFGLLAAERLARMVAR